MKTLISVIIFCFSLVANAAEIFTYNLKENQKYEKSISVNIGNEATLHLIIVKNKDSKMYDLLPFYMNSTGEIKELATASFEDNPDLLSYHKAGNTITLLNYQRKAVSIMDFNLENGTMKSSEVAVRKKPETIFKQGNKSTILIPEINGKSLEFITIENSQSITNKEITVPAAHKKEIASIFTIKPEIVDTNEFVQNGSIAEYQAYSSNGIFILVSDGKTDENLDAFIINPSAENPFEKKTFSTSKLDKIKDSNSHIVDDKLFGMFLNKEDFVVSVFDINTGKEEKSLLLSEDIAKIESSKKTQTFLKESSKAKMKTTVSVNKTKNGNFAITLDYVNKEQYFYYNHWFFMHMMIQQQQMMMMQQQRMINNSMRPGGFGPNPASFEIEEMFFEDKSTPLNFTLDKNLELLQTNEPTQYQFVDKEKYLKSLNENKELKNTTVGFLENEYRYMYTDKKEEVVYIKTKEIIREY